MSHVCPQCGDTTPCPGDRVEMGVTCLHPLALAADAYRVLLQDAEPGTADRDGLQATPARAAAAWRELTAGYFEPPPALTTFDVDYDELVTVAPMAFYSLCEHHLLPFHGTVRIAYIPAGRVLGLSKFARVARHFARRLQVQERMTAQIADYLDDALHPTALGVVVRAEHLCMSMRGVQVPGAITTTSVMRGAFRDKPEARAEALKLMNGGSE